MDPKNEKPTTEQPEKTTPTAADAGQPGQPPQVTFTQDQLDAIVKDRLERANKSTISGILEELGIEDLETVKKTLTEAQKAREAQMSELEKAQAQIAELEAKAEKARQEAEAEKVKANEALLKSAVTSKAAGFNDPMDAWQFIDRSKITRNEDGTYTGLDDALKALSEAKPYLLKGDDRPNGPGTPARKRPQTIVEKMIAEQEKNRPKSVDELRPTITF